MFRQKKRRDLMLILRLCFVASVEALLVPCASTQLFHLVTEERQSA
jgi:hypothetical protein